MRALFRAFSSFDLVWSAQLIFSLESFRFFGFFATSSLFVFLLFTWKILPFPSAAIVAFDWSFFFVFFVVVVVVATTFYLVTRLSFLLEKISPCVAHHTIAFFLFFFFFLFFLSLQKDFMLQKNTAALCQDSQWLYLSIPIKQCAPRNKVSRPSLLCHSSILFFFMIFVVSKIFSHLLSPFSVTYSITAFVAFLRRVSRFPGLY